jgi:hypothetical protein
VGSWKSQLANIVHSRAHHPSSQPTIAAQLLGEPAAGEPYTILIMGLCHVSGNFLPFKGKSPLLSSQAAPFFSFVKGKKSLLQRNPAHMTRANVCI